MIRLIASDIDGTLLQNGAAEIPPEIFDHIRRLEKKGVLFCPASGRQYTSLRRLFAPVADRVPFLCENGAVVYGPGSPGPILSKTVMDRRRGEEPPEAGVLPSAGGAEEDALLFQAVDVVKDLGGNLRGSVLEQGPVNVAGDEADHGWSSFFLYQATFKKRGRRSCSKERRLECFFFMLPFLRCGALRSSIPHPRTGFKPEFRRRTVKNPCGSARKRRWRSPGKPSIIESTSTQEVTE